MNHKDYGFEPEYSYHPNELELISFLESLEVRFQGEPVHFIHLPQKLHQKYFEAYKKQVETKLHLVKPYLSGIESFLAMASNLSKQGEIEFFVKKEVYRL